jgi:hypothetical protein
MAWFLSIMGTIFLILFCLGIWVEKMNQRRKLDVAYDNKVTRIMDRIDPYYNFFFNLFGWALALLVIYFIYLG